MLGLELLLEALFQPSLNGGHVFAGSDVILAGSLAASESKILGHDTVNVDGVNAGLLQSLSEGNDFGGIVELAALDKTTGPGEYGGNGVSGGLTALLVLAIVAGDGAVGGLGLEGLAIGGDEDRGHETKGAEALRDYVGLNITIVVCQV